MIKRKEIFGEETPVIVPENAADAQFQFTYISCLCMMLDEIKGLGQDHINAIFARFKCKWGMIDGKPVVNLDYPGGVPGPVIEAAKEYAKKFKK